MSVLAVDAFRIVFRHGAFAYTTLLTL